MKCVPLTMECLCGRIVQFTSEEIQVECSQCGRVWARRSGAVGSNQIDQRALPKIEWRKTNDQTGTQTPAI